MELFTAGVILGAAAGLIMVIIYLTNPLVYDTITP